MKKTTIFLKNGKELTLPNLETDSTNELIHMIGTALLQRQAYVSLDFGETVIFIVTKDISHWVVKNVQEETNNS